MKKEFKFWKELKTVCYGNIAVKVVDVPITLLIAQLLSMIIQKAGSGMVSEVAAYSGALIGIVSLAAVIRIVLSIWIRRKQSKALNHCKHIFLEKFLSNALSKLFQADFGQVVENLTVDFDKVTNRYIALYPTIVSSAIGILGYGIFIFHKNLLAGATVLGIGCLQLLPPIIVKKYMQINYDRCEELEEKITNHIAEAVNGFDVIKMNALKAWWFQKIETYYKEYIHVGHVADAVASGQQAMNRLLDHILKFGTYILMGVYVLLKICSFDTAIQVIYLSASLFAFMNALFAVIPEAAVADTAQKRLDMWADAELACEDSDFAVSGADKITVDQLTYGYDEKRILDHVSCQLEAEKTYIIKGKNGSGKTTFVNLLAGLLTPDDGTISAERKNSAASARPVRKSDICYIPQYDPEYSFHAETLFQMFDQKKQEKIMENARALGLTDAIIQKNTIQELSGGERKKVFLALGLAMDAKWIILDEPTNNLDDHGKKALCDLLRERKAAIVISHDPILDQAADQIIRFENGTVC